MRTNEQIEKIKETQSDPVQYINFVKQDKLVDGNGKKKPNFEEISERKFRADKIDGLRPIRKYRK